MMDQATVIEATRRWISTMVIGLNLCPFAERVFQAEKIRYVVSNADDEDSLLNDLAGELELLSTSSITMVETTLLIHPRVLGDFFDFNDFLDRADGLILEKRLRNMIQIASFHPDYQFANTDPDAAENYTNRSPYPMLHLLREESISKVAGNADELQAIPERNIEMLRGLGVKKILQKLGKKGDGCDNE